MKTLKETTTKDGKRRVTVELAEGEKLLAVRDGAFYRLGDPLDEVLPGHMLLDSKRVVWCPVAQRWTE